MNLEGEEIVVEVNVKDFDLEQIFECGQCFRWQKESDSSYTGIAYGKLINISYKPSENDKYKGIIKISNTTEEEYKEIWENYFDLKTDYGIIKKDFKKKDEVMVKAIQSGEGIRILNQEIWETIISFIISQNNNITRIKNCIENLCIRYGEKICTYKGVDKYAFPTVKVLASLKEEDLEPVKLGYRSKYIIETSRQLLDKMDSNETFDFLKYKKSNEVEEFLTHLSGVGPKVANCIMLFSCEKKESFPIDVWVKRLMNRFYGIPEARTGEMKEYAENNFGKYGGIAQQYLFHYIRNLDKK